MPAVTAPPYPSSLTGHDLYLFREGTHSRLYEKLGAHVLGDGTQFAVWAPNAAQVSVIGDFNGWDPARTPCSGSEAGIWSAGCPGEQGSLYKYHVVSRRQPPRRQVRPVRLPRRDAAEDRLDGVDPRLRVGRRRVDEEPPAPTRSTRRGRSTRHLGSWRASPTGGAS